MSLYSKLLKEWVLEHINMLFLLEGIDVGVGCFVCGIIQIASTRHNFVTDSQLEKSQKSTGQK